MKIKFEIFISNITNNKKMILNVTFFCYLSSVEEHNLYFQLNFVRNLIIWI